MEEKEKAMQKRKMFQLMIGNLYCAIRTNLSQFNVRARKRTRALACLNGLNAIWECDEPYNK